MRNAEIFTEKDVDLVNIASITTPINTDTSKKPTDQLKWNKPPKRDTSETKATQEMKYFKCKKQYCFMCVSETKINDLDILTVLDNLPEKYTVIFKNRYSLTDYKRERYSNYISWKTF